MDKPTPQALEAYKLLQGGVKTAKELAKALNISYAAAILRFHHAKRIERDIEGNPKYAEQIAELERRSEKEQEDKRTSELDGLFSGESGDLRLWDALPGSVTGSECQACGEILKREKAIVLQIKGDDPKVFHRKCLLALMDAYYQHMSIQNLKRKGKTCLQPIAYSEKVNADDPIEDLMLPVRPANMCRNAGIKTLRDVLEKSDHEILKCKNFGRKSLYELKQEIICHGIPRCDLKGKDNWPFFEKEMFAPPERKEPLPSLYEYRYVFNYKGAIIIDVNFLGNKMFSSQALAENDVIRTDAQMILLPHSIILLNLKTGVEIHRIGMEKCPPYMLIIKPEALEQMRAQPRTPTRADFMEVEWSVEELYRRMMSQFVPDTEYKGDPGFTFTRQGYGLKRSRIQCSLRLINH
jgi:hypothetical protein